MNRLTPITFTDEAEKAALDKLEKKAVMSIELEEQATADLKRMKVFEQEALKGAIAAASPAEPQALEVFDPATLLPAAEILAKSSLCPTVLRGKPEDVLVCLMGAQAIDISPFQAIFQGGFYVVHGRLGMEAKLMRQLVISSPVCEWLQKGEHTLEACTWKTKRKGHPKPSNFTFTLDDARAQGLLGKDNWKKQAKAMLSERASAGLCREVYPDLLAGVTYTPEELRAIGDTREPQGDGSAETPPTSKLDALLPPLDVPPMVALGRDPAQVVAVRGSSLPELGEPAFEDDSTAHESAVLRREFVMRFEAAATIGDIDDTSGAMNATPNPPKDNMTTEDRNKVKKAYTAALARIKKAK